LVAVWAVGRIAGETGRQNTAEGSSDGGLSSINIGKSPLIVCHPALSGKRLLLTQLNPRLCRVIIKV